MSNIRKIKTILSSSRLFEQSSSRNLSAGKLDSTYYNFMTASYLSNEHLQDSMTFAMTAPLIFQIDELKGDVDDLHTHLSESLYTNRETSFGGSILVSSHITASGNISSSGTLLGNSLTLGGTAITSTGTELNIVDGGTVASNITPQDADRVVYNDGGVMRQVTITKLASYFDDEITNMPNLADIGTDLTVAGNITATSLNVTSITSSIVTSSILQTEGSNIFGDTISDTHLFNGHITASGNISASGTIIGGGLNINGTTTFNDNSITNVNQIDLDGFRADSATNVQVSLGAQGVDVVMEDGDSFSINSGEVDADFTYFDSGEASLIHGDALLSRVGISDTSPVSKLDVGGDLNVQSHITSSGNISSSGNILGDKVYVANNLAVSYNSGYRFGFANNTPIQFGKTANPIHLIGSVTASGDISASGTITGNELKISTTTEIGASDSTINRDLSVGRNISLAAALVHTGDTDTKIAFTTEKIESTADSISLVGNVTASGDISSSGVIYGKQIQHTYHQFDNASNASVNYIPAPGAYVIEGTSINYYRKWLAPYKGKIKKIVIHAENDCGTTRVSLYTNGVFSGYHQQALGATTAVVFDDFTDGLSGNPNFDQHDLIAIAVDPANIPGEVNLVCSWEYEIDS